MSALKDQVNLPRENQGLWTKATALLSEGQAKFLDYDQTSPEQILRAVEQRIADCQRRQWSFRKSNGEVVLLRNVFEKIAGSIKKFQQVGDSIVQYDPAHAALAWAGVRFVLEIFISDSQRYCAMIEGLEFVSKAIVLFADYEKGLLLESSELKIRLEKCIVTAYSMILRYFVEAKRYWHSPTGSRFLKSLIPGLRVTEILDLLAREEKDAYKLFSLVQAEDQAKGRSNLEKALEDIQAKLGELNQNVEQTRGSLLRRLAPVYTNENFENNISLRASRTATLIFEQPIFQKIGLPLTHHSQSCCGYVVHLALESQFFPQP